VGLLYGSYIMPYYPYPKRLTGLRINYNINEDLYVHLDYDQTTVSSKSLRLLPAGCLETGLNCVPIVGSGERKWSATTVGFGFTFSEIIRS
jgi:hypothetical protein